MAGLSLLDWLRRLKGMLHTSARSPAATRVGLLNSGELVLIDGEGGITVFGTATTALISELLINVELPGQPDRICAGCND